MKSEILLALKNYYSEKLKLHGPTYKGADWGTLQAQQLSFVQLARLLPEAPYTLLDYGCGYGGLYDFLSENDSQVQYSGYDISEEMINHARQLHGSKDAAWINTLPEKALFDYVIACGVFSVRLNIPQSEWEEHMLQTLHKLDSLSSKGFAFNSLTSYSDPHLMKDYLYYPDPCFLFDYCKKHFSRYVSLVHDYPKYEFAIIVRKDI
ncbi:MAG TPA: class I SAM-dependent methyltransferase [Bacteroidia bacterium]|jgi:SAM-dependent methyltransferase